MLITFFKNPKCKHDYPPLNSTMLNRRCPKYKLWPSLIPYSYASLIDTQLDVSVLNALPQWLRREGANWQGPSTSRLYSFPTFWTYIDRLASFETRPWHSAVCQSTSRLQSCPFTRVRAFNLSFYCISDQLLLSGRPIDIPKDSIVLVRYSTIENNLRRGEVELV